MSRCTRIQVKWMLMIFARQAAKICARNHSPIDDCRNANLRQYSLGAKPISRLKTRLKELSDPYPTAEATSDNDELFERIMAPALCIRHRVRYSSGSLGQNSLKS